MLIAGVLMGTSIMLGNFPLNNVSPERLANYTPASVNESKTLLHFILSPLILLRVLTLLILIYFS